MKSSVKNNPVPGQQVDAAIMDQLSEKSINEFLEAPHATDHVFSHPETDKKRATKETAK